MRAQPPSFPSAPVEVYAPPARFTIEQYHAMVEANILTEDTRVELLAGQIVAQRPINPPHAAAIDRLRRTLTRKLDEERSLVRTENPVVLSEASEPQPDGMVLRRREDDYAYAHPTPADVRLVVEVADSSLKHDREGKMPLYAAAGIREYWIVNLVDRQLERYTEPVPEIRAVGRPATYARSEVFADGERFDHATYGTIVVGELLPALPPAGA